LSFSFPTYQRRVRHSFQRNPVNDPTAGLYTLGHPPSPRPGVFPIVWPAGWHPRVRSPTEKANGLATPHPPASALVRQPGRTGSPIGGAEFDRAPQEWLRRTCGLRTRATIKCMMKSKEANNQSISAYLPTYLSIYLSARGVSDDLDDWSTHNTTTRQSVCRCSVV